MVLTSRCRLHPLTVGAPRISRGNPEPHHFTPVRRLLNAKLTPPPKTTPTLFDLAHYVHCNRISSKTTGEVGAMVARWFSVQNAPKVEGSR
jgi:hypothetical protein